MSTIVTFNGSSYTVPATGDSSWGTNVSNYLIALATGSLQKTGGTFTLTAETDFGATYGLKSAYYKSRGTNPSSTGVIRLANTESISWRNAANNADIALKVNASNFLEYAGTAIITSGNITNADISASAAIAYSKLNLSGSIVNADISASAAIAYSKLNLATSLVNADISASAAIAYSKLAALTASRAVVTDGSGVLTVATTTATEIGYVNGVTSAIQTQLDAKVAKSTFTTKGDILVATGSATPARLAVGLDGQLPYADSSQSSNILWATPPSSNTQITNLGLAVSVAANAVTFALKQNDGASNPTSGLGAVSVGMRSSTATSGLYNLRSVTSSLSLTVSSGSTLGQVSNKPARVYIYLIDNSGTLELAVSQTLYHENQFISTTAEGGAGAADSGVTAYSTTARSNVPFRLIGFWDNTQTTAGTWTSAGSKLQVGDYGTLTGETVCALYTGAGPTGTLTSAYNVTTYGTVVKDTHSAYSSGTYTVPISGLYTIAATNRQLATYSLGKLAIIAIFIDGTQKYTNIQEAAAAVAGLHPSVTVNSVYLTAGQTVDVRSYNDATTPTFAAVANQNYFSITKIGNY
jgi:hypothetical protein